MTIKTIVFPSSANPPTYGHLDVLVRLTKLFDKVIWAIADNTHKTYLFNLEQRLKLARLSLEDIKLKGVEVMKVEGSVAHMAVSVGAMALARSLRGAEDYALEKELAFGNSLIAPELETIIVMSRPQFSAMSSSLARELFSLKMPLKEFVTPSVEKEMKKIIDS